MANPGPAIAGIPNTELFLSTGPLSRVIYPTGFTNGGAIGNGTLSFNYYPATAAVSGTRLDGLFNIAVATSATANTGAAVITVIGGVYTQLTSVNTAGSTTYLSLLSGGSTQTTYTWASNNSGQSQLTAAAVRPLSVPVNINLQPGEYYVALGVSTNSSSIGTATTALAFSASIQAALTNMTATNYAEFTAATTANSGLYGAMGVYSAATAVLPGTVNVTAINQTGANLLGGNFAFVIRNY
jgi:hypothetical protein